MVLNLQDSIEQNTFFVELFLVGIVAPTEIHIAWHLAS